MLSSSIWLIRVILELKMTFGQELVVLHTSPCMFGKFLVHAWRKCGGSRGANMSLVLNEPK